MARAHTAYLTRSTVPARKALQAAIDALKFKLTLDDGYAPFETSGYLPCTLDGEDAGFDLRFADVEADAPPNLAAALEGRDAAMKIRWSGDLREQLAALVVSLALAETFGAILHDADTDKILTAKSLQTQARNLAEEM